MKTAIIGGAGFIGSSIARLIKDKNEYVCVFDTKERLDLNANVLKGIPKIVLPFPDVNNLNKNLFGFDSLIILSCTSEPESSMNSIPKDAENNVIPSLKIFDIAVSVGISKIIFSSSGGTIYGNPKRIPVKEDQLKNPISAYGVAKLTIEHYLSLYAKHFPLKGISLRLANPYGVYQLRGTSVGVIAHYLNSVKYNKSITVWGDGSIVRDYIHIGCVARAFEAALFSTEIPSGSYNIGSGKGITLNDLIRIIFKVTGKKVPVDYSTDRLVDVKKITLNSNLFSSITGWKPECSFFEGVSLLWKNILTPS